jgi:hypothetical protein
VRTHLREQPWASQVIGIRIEYPDDAEAAEREAVWAERPPDNVVFNGHSPPSPPDRAARLRTELVRERRRLADPERAVPESSAHLRLIARGIKAKNVKIAKLPANIENFENAGSAGP